MKTKKKAASLVNEPEIEIVASEAKPNGAEPTPAQSDQSQSTRMSAAWYIRPDGSIDTGRMHEKTRTMLREFVTDPRTMSALGIESKKEAFAVAAVFDESWCAPLYDMLGTIECALAPRVLHVPAEIAARVFVYSDAEKKALAGPTAAVLNKYATDWMIRFKEEIALAMLLATITAMKVRLARQLADEFHKAEALRAEETEKKNAAAIN